MTDTHTPFLIVLCTAPNEETAASLARSLIESKLAACVNVVPGVRSLYVWDGVVQDERELLLLIKAPRASFPAIERHLTEHHPYEVPEIIAAPIAAGSAPYLAWLAASTAE